MVNPSKTSCSDFSKSVMLISSVLLSVACLAGLIHVEFELSVHREMLKVLNQQTAEKFEPKEKKLPVEVASDMKMLPSDSNKELPSFRYRRNTGTTSTVSNSSKTVNHQELQLALSSLACSVQCPKGTRGKRGRPGHPGQPGKHGPAGPQGVRGFQGEPGIQGIQGLPGPKGDQGLEGPKGDPGKSISAPSIVSPPRSMVVNRTDTASFQCEAEGNPEPKVTWLKRNSSLPPSKRVAQSRAGLMITEVTSQDDGMYTCVAENILGAVKASATLTVQVGALITRKPLSTIVEEGQNVTLACEATGQPKPSVTWNKLAVGHVPKEKYRVIDGNLTILNIARAAGGEYVCSAKNLLNEDSAFAQIMVVKKLKLTSPPPVKLSVSSQTDVILKCLAQGAIDTVWQRAGKNLPQNHVLHRNGTLLLKSVTTSDAGTYTCVARNFHRSVKANTVLEVKFKTCSDLKTGKPGNSSGYYVIDPDGDGGVASFRVYCDMRDKGGVGVTVISHDSESRTHVGNIPGCGSPGCYSKSVTYTGASTAQLAALTRASKNCEQFIKFECNNDVGFVETGYAWWMSRDGRKMNYWGGASAGSRMCACGVTNSCSNGKKCNCDYGSTDSGWREDSGSLTDKSALPVSQIKLGDLDQSHEEGYHTLGKLKCYGVA